MKSEQSETNRLVSIIQQLSIVRARDLLKHRIHPEVLQRAAHRGLVVKVGRGIYTRKDLPTDIERQILLAMKRVPHGVVCLESALMFHGLVPTGPGPLWIAIDRKARKPIVNGQLLRFVRFGGNALTQGVVNTRIDGVPIRVYSLAKTVADCLKYRKRIRPDLAQRALKKCIACGKCSIERLRHFAKICRVAKLVQAAYSSRTKATRTEMDLDSRELASSLAPGFSES
jgi:predicted transcriptional regulator of viral defense system